MRKLRSTAVHLIQSEFLPFINLYDWKDVPSGTSFFVEMMEDPHKYKAEAEDMKQILLFLCMVILAIGIDFHGVNFQKLQKSTITVTVKGQVQNPGRVELPMYATVEDALRKVQLENDADLSSLNPDTVLKDHDVLTIPQKEEIVRISINAASAEQLSELPGIGPSTAERIVAYRQENGYFQTVEDLMQVKGIGQAKFDKLKDRIQL